MKKSSSPLSVYRPELQGKYTAGSPCFNRAQSKVHGDSLQSKVKLASSLLSGEDGLLCINDTGGVRSVRIQERA